MSGTSKNKVASYELRVADTSHRAVSPLAARYSLLATRRRPRRRGVLLLVVLSLLVLFLMIGTAFIITTKQSEKSAKAFRKAAENQTSEAARGNLLDDVLLQLIRDTDNPQSVLRSHSLLGDLYGNDGFRGTVATSPVGARWAGMSLQAPATPANVTNGQMIEINLAADATLTNVFGIPALNPNQFLSQTDDAYSGLVLTFVNGPARGRSTRIVGYRPVTSASNNLPLFTIMSFPLADGSLMTDPAVLQGSRIVVNGRPFNGTGAGLDPTLPPGAPGAKLVATETDGAATPTPLGPVALLPNPVFFNPRNVTLTDTTIDLTTTPGYYFADTVNGTDMAGRGGADESYDAADFQNMFLAAVQDESGDMRNNPGDGTLRDMVLPSFHRPELVNYWNTRVTGSGDPIVVPTGTNAQLLRKVLLRPNHLDHPNFTGSNLQYETQLLAYKSDPSNVTFQQNLLYSYVYGPWDVDNDNDGNRDSVWIDAGLPLVLGPHGRLVKPMVAMLVVDLDGRLNINTANTADMVNNSPGLGVAQLADGVLSNTTPRGTGWGPADISTLAALGPGSTGNLLTGNDPAPGATGGGRFAGRYGRDDAPGRNPAPTGAAYLDLMSQIQFFGWPLRGVYIPSDPTPRQSSFAAPPDLRGRYGNGINDYGQQVIEATLTSEASSREGSLLADSPYETNFYAEGMDTANSPVANDTPFSLAELERMLRVYDTDGFTQPNRLTDLSGDPAQVHLERNRITTESWNVRTPLVTLPHEMDDPSLRLTTNVAAHKTLIQANPALARLPQSTAELFEMRIRKALWPADQTKIFPQPLYDPTSSDPQLNNPANRDRVRAILRQLLAPELAAGLKLDVNRPLGNGRDDNNNGVVDEAGEDLPSLTTTRAIWEVPPPSAAADPLAASFRDQRFIPLPVRYIPDRTRAPTVENVPDADYDAFLQRQLLARHLYVLALVQTAEPDFAATTPMPPSDAARARRIAQWAINSVDFRDPDATMSSFEYDLNPFDGWDVNGLVGDMLPGPDGILGTADDAAAPSTDDNQNFRDVVWGAERPELVITETYAMHDRNTTDEADEDPNQGEEPGDASDPLNEVGGEFDQLYRPRGSFFVELYNPWPAVPAPSLDIHKIWNGNDVGVDIAKCAGPDGNSPVWRLVVYSEQDITKDPDDPNNQPGGLNRSVYFAGFNPEQGSAPGDPRNIPAATTWQEDGTAFYNDYTDANARNIPPVRPGRYLVVGSGTETAANSGIYESQLGQRLDQLPSDRPRKPLRRIELNTNLGATASPPVRLVDNDTGENTTAMMRNAGANQPVGNFRMEPPTDALAVGEGMPQAASDQYSSSYVTDVAVINAPRRLSLSEPNDGYPHSIGNVAWVDRTDPGYPTNRDPSEDGYYANGMGRDPQTRRPIGNPNQPKAIDTPLDDLGGDPALQQIGTTYNYRQVFLQRLANPLAPFHPTMNPYRTVDRSTVNLTVFNGRLARTQQEKGRANTDAREGFSSLERGFRGTGQGDDEFNLWAVQPIDRQGTIRNNPSRTAANRSATEYSLRAVPPITLGFLNQAYMDNNAGPGNDVLQRVKPDDPFPWLAWNDRPFVSGNELLLVPHVRSSQLLNSFSMADDDNRSMYDTETIYDPTRDPRQIESNDVTGYTHLENFFFDEEPDGGNPLNDQPSHLYRVLEYVQTPSLFAGSSTWLNPTMLPLPATSLATDDPRYNFRPPFNRVSQYREPGRVNLNTIFSPAVYGGLFHSRDVNNPGSDVEPDGNGMVHPGPDWDDFYESRRGHTTGNDMLSLDPATPTLFANPFRASGAANLVPLPGMVQRRGSDVVGVECTLFRSDDSNPGDVDNEPLFGGETNDDHNEWERNAFFRYAPMTRLDNLTSTQSNVFAVWITVGFFEVEEADRNDFNTKNPTLSGQAQTDMFNRVYPDGVMLGKEDGLDEGDVRRLRGFYIIDRSRPAGFVPGQDVNAEITIRLHRRIE
jgi:hypothetical protein